MSHFQKILTVLLSGILLFCTSVFPVGAQAEVDTPPSLSAKSAILMEAESGAVIYEKNADTPLPMASTTKIMTALVAMELASPERLIEIDPRAVGVEGSSVYLVEGEVLTLRELLYALLLESANDAATAIAVGLCGSVENFADAMNRRARELGLVSTHFTNPHGLDDNDHYTTARELAIIAREALQNPCIRTICSTYKATIPHNGIPDARLLVNHNKLLRMYEGCIGMKTGFTKKSGRSLVSAAMRDGVTLIAVTINAPDDWADHTSLLDYGFSKFHRVSVASAGDALHTLPIVGGMQSSVRLISASDCAITLPSDLRSAEIQIECRRFEFAGIQKGARLGTARILADINGDGKSETVQVIPLYAEKTVEALPKKKGFFAWLRELFS